MSKEVPYPCVGKPGGPCPSICCFQALDALKSLLDLRADGLKTDPAIFDFPYTIDPENGRCEKLLDDGGCSVYLDRPMLCNIDRAAAAMDWDPIIFKASNAEACNHHMTEVGIPKEQQIDVEKYRVALVEEWTKSKSYGTVQNS